MELELKKESGCVGLKLKEGGCVGLKLKKGVVWG